MGKESKIGYNAQGKGLGVPLQMPFNKYAEDALKNQLHFTYNDNS